MTEKNDKNSQRRRGVRASRARLVSALTEAGLKTQAALAERIADIEGLDAAPKDVVNRVFREMPVDVTTLERIARALGVEAYSLYKTSDEPDSGRGDRVRTDDQGDGSFSIAAVVAIVAAVAVVSVVAAWLGGNGFEFANTRTSTTVTEQNEPLDLGDTSLVVMELDGDESGVLSAALRASLREHFSVASDTASVLTAALDVKSAAERLRTDVVVDGELVSVGRLAAVRVYLYARGVRQQIWAESWPDSALTDRLAKVVDNVSRAVRIAVGIPAPELGHFPLAPVQDDYLEGEFHLDQPASELNIKRAQARFEAALRQNANYALAHAGLCQALLEEHWMSDEERALTDAAKICGRAIQLAPDHPTVAAAHAHFLRRTGRNEEAMALYEQTLVANPKDAALLYGLSNSRLAAYRQSGDAVFLRSAKEAALAATDADTSYWKAPFGLATLEWFDGNLSGAIAAAEIALARHENEMVLGNLGSFYICEGSFDKARVTYTRARTINPASYVGDEFLGQAYYFLGDFETSAQLRRRAIDGIATGAPEIHEMWGNLGESYRQTGDVENAIDAFVRAAEIAERDYLRGTAPVGDRAARAYYYVSLSKLDAGRVATPVIEEIEATLDEIAAELGSASEHRRMALTYLLLGNKSKARASVEQAMSTCPGYGEMPDFVALN